MDSRRVWVLNLEADLELAAPREGRGFRPSEAVRKMVAAQLPHARCLLGPGDVLVDELDGVAKEGRVGRAWCPTHSALARLRAVGCLPEPSPLVEVVRRVNDRRFCFELGGGLPDAAHVDELESVRTHVARPASVGTGGWLLKRAFSVAGRGQRRVRAGQLTREDERWIRASLKMGGISVEPQVEVLAEFALHGLLAEGGEVGFGEVCLQVCDASGAWVETRRLGGELSGEEVARLRDEGVRVARALEGAGYFGPFGIDAYRWRGEGVAQFHVRSEINARYSMGWSVGMGRWE